MRLLYETHSSRVRAELALLAADAGAITAAVLFATGASFARAQLPDLALLVVWSAIPVAIARVLRGIELPREPWRRMLPSALLGLSLAALVVLGLELVRSVAPDRSIPETGLSAVLFLAWASGVLIFYPRAYRLHDFLLIACILLALKEGRPPYIHVPLFLGCFFLSSFLRHVVHDILPPRRRDATVNLQNARVVSVAAAGAAAIVFAGAGFAWSALWKPDPGGAPPERPRAAARKTAERPGSSAREAPERGVFVWEPPAGGLGADGAKATVGFSHRVGLRELTNARLDMREVLRIEPARAGGEDVVIEPVLWRGIALTVFDARSDSWVEEVEAARRVPWPAGGVLRRSSARSSDEVRLRATIVTPVLRSIVFAYGTGGIAAGFPEYSETPTGDVFPHPRPGPGASYELAIDRWALRAGSHLHLPLHIPGEAGGCLDLPPEEAVGLDLRRLARSIFKPGSASVTGRTMELEGWFGAEGFRYAGAAGWRGRHPLARFLGEEKAGDCTYFATASALLFRAAGVPARVVAGFLGGEMEGSAIVLRQKDAHAWVEVHDPERGGWTPVDPTAWVPADPSYVPEPDLVLDPSRRGSVFRTLESDSSPRTDAEFSSGSDDSREPSRAVEPLPEETAPAREPEPSGDIALTESPPRADEESWVAFSEYVLPEEDALLENDAGGAGAGRTTDPRGRKGSAPAAGPSTAESATSAAPSGLPAPLRLALAAAGGLVALLVIRAFLRPAREEGEEDAPETTADATSDAAPLGPLSAKLDESDPRDRVLAEYLRLQAALLRTRKHRRPPETPLEHARAAGRGERGAREPFIKLYRILYRLVYGSETIGEEDASAARESCRKLRRLLG